MVVSLRRGRKKIKRNLNAQHKNLLNPCKKELKMEKIS